MTATARLTVTTATASAEPAEAMASARAAGLRYVGDAGPGIRRVRVGAGFRYVGPDGRVVRDRPTLDRIRALAIPPAYRDVWICPLANGHLQATGRDARGRKQYRYHPRWRQVRDENKYGRLTAFGAALASIRAKTGKHLALDGLPREKVLATVVRLLEATLIRVGNEEYVRENRSFGLTTLRNRHVEIRGAAVRFTFRGKSGLKHAIELNDPRLARVIRTCRDLPGQELFQYLDDAGEPRVIRSEDVNDYLREITGSDFTAKDFRTWAGTVMALCELQRCGPGGCVTECRRNVVAAVKAVAGRLGNTQAVCRKCYIHPAVLEAYLAGGLPKMLTVRGHRPTGSHAGLRREEVMVLRFLSRSLRRPA